MIRALNMRWTIVSIIVGLLSTGVAPGPGSLCSTAAARDIVDATGARIVLPDRIERVMASVRMSSGNLSG